MVQGEVLFNDSLAPKKRVSADFRSSSAMAQPMLISDIPDPRNLDVEGEWLEVEGDELGDAVKRASLVIFHRRCT